MTWETKSFVFVVNVFDSIVLQYKFWNAISNIRDGTSFLICQKNTAGRQTTLVVEGMIKQFLILRKDK